MYPNDTFGLEGCLRHLYTINGWDVILALPRLENSVVQDQHESCLLSYDDFVSQLDVSIASCDDSLHGCSSHV